MERISHERMGAGPAIPLIYDYYKSKFPDLERILEKGDGAKTPDEIESKDIITAGVEQKDPLCMKVVKKFTEIFAVEAGDFALKTLPYGGVYLVGGVTMGLSDYIVHDETFTKTFYNKGRLRGTMKRFPI